MGHPSWPSPEGRKRRGDFTQCIEEEKERSREMALSGLDIFKLLPKTNCGDCKLPTCLAFAMKLAGGQAKLEECPTSLTSKGGPRRRGGTPIAEIIVGRERRSSRPVRSSYCSAMKRGSEPDRNAILVSDAMSDDELKAKVEQAARTRGEGRAAARGKAPGGKVRVRRRRQVQGRPDEGCGHERPCSHADDR